jgi:hypothetical protein
LRIYSIDTRVRAAGFHRSCKEASTLKPSDPPARINPCDARKRRRQDSAVNDALLAAVIGAIAGYIIARHCPELDWILQILTG